ncbi:hypothetical protein HHI36_012013, partial [Cryptolaemus montrouzieri]
TESWLNPQINSCEVMCDSYSIFRKDRRESNSSKSEGGGVLVGVTKEYHVGVLSAWINTLIVEDIWLKNVISNQKTFWSYVSDLKKDVTVPHVMKLDQAELNDCDSISDAFGGYFEDSNTPVLYE